MMDLTLEDVREAVHLGGWPVISVGLAGDITQEIWALLHTYADHHQVSLAAWDLLPLGSALERQEAARQQKEKQEEARRKRIK